VSPRGIVPAMRNSLTTLTRAIERYHHYRGMASDTRVIAAIDRLIAEADAKRRAVTERRGSAKGFDEGADRAAPNQGAGARARDP
jgi:hypothetical protein